MGSVAAVRLKRAGALAAVGLLTTALASAQRVVERDAEERLVVRSFTLRHQPVREAVALIFPLLTDLGSVDVSPGSNTVVVRDRQAAIDRVLVLLEDFDQPGRAVDLAIRMVSAAVGPEEDGGDLGLPEELVRRLHELLRYRSYHRVASADLTVREGRSVESDLGEGYRARFEVGRLEADGRIKLLGFQIYRRDRQPTAPPLIHTNINLRLDKPMVLGLARTESSERALMVILNCSQAAGAEPETVER